MEPELFECGEHLCLQSLEHCLTHNRFTYNSLHTVVLENYLPDLVGMTYPALKLEERTQISRLSYT